MLSRKHSIEGKRPFVEPGDFFDDMDSRVAARLAMAAGDISLILDENGTIVDGTANVADFPEFPEWIGKDFLDTVNIESRGKVLEMLASARKGQTQHWRQVNHPTAQGDIPVRYVMIGTGQGNCSIALGRDMRDAAALQQRLLQAQQSLERDYLRLRQVETRYRLLFELSSEPILIVDAGSYRIREANPAAANLLGTKSGSLAGGKLTGLVGRGSREQLIAYLGSVMSSRSIAPMIVDLADGEGNLTLTATGFRQQGGQFLLVRLAAEQIEEGDEASTALQVLEEMPDAFVLADAQMEIVACNLAFVELVEAASAEQVQGMKLSEFIGRAGVDLDLIAGQLSKYGFARNVATVVGAREGFDGEPVELSAVSTSGNDPHHGFVIRAVGRRLRDLPPTGEDLPRSVEQLTQLVGRMSLKDIVRESTDLIERLCIEAALTYTSDNRASAAEILGLSRQSLYSKLHRYGLGNLMPEED